MSKVLLRCGFLVQLDREPDGCDVRKLRTVAKAAVGGIEHRHDLVGEPVHRHGGRRSAARVRGRALPGLNVAARRERVGNPLQDVGEPAQLDVGAAAEQLTVGSEEGRRGPGAEAVPLADIRPAVGVDANRHEPVVDEGREAGVGITGAIHLAAVPGTS